MSRRKKEESSTAASVCAVDSGSSAGAERRRSRKIRPGVQEFRRLGYQVKIVERGMKSRGQGAGQQNNAVSDVLSAVRQQQWSGDRSRPGASHMPPSVARAQDIGTAATVS